MRRVLLMAAVFAVLGGCGDGTEEQPGAGPTVGAELDITVEHPDRDTVAYRLVCEGEPRIEGDGAEVDPAAACDSLADPEVRTRIVDGPPDDQMCTEIYGGPDTARITGTLDGMEIDTSVDRVNGCGIHDWDELLAPLLPPALGVTESS